MYNLKEKDEVIQLFVANVKENKEENLKDLDIVSFMEKGNTELVRSCINKIKANMDISIPVGHEVPKFSLYTSPTGAADGSISMITITITQRIKSDKKFRFSYNATKENTVDSIVNFLTATYSELLVDDMASANIAEVNELLDEVVKEAGLTYTVSIVSSMGNAGKKIAYLGDDTIQFVADDERIFDMDDILVVQSVGDVVTEEMLAEAKKALVDELAAAQTVEQLVQLYGGALVSYVCDINKRVKPMTLIRKVCNRNAVKVMGNKDCFAYYNDEARNIFAIVAKRDGEFEVVLSPFNTETFRKEAVDVVELIKAEISNQ